MARTRAWPAADIVVNVQGDEPLMPRALIEQVAALLTAHPQADIATLVDTLDSLAELMEPNVVKVVSDARGRALYFSRAPIPWNREGAPAGLATQRDFGGARRHIGLYAYRVGALLRLATAAARAARGAREARAAARPRARHQHPGGRGRPSARGRM